MFLTCSPASGTTFSIGTTTVTCSATDAHSNTASKSFNVTVVLVDSNPPVLTGIPANLAREANGPYGSRVSYVPPTAVDDVDGPLPVTCAPASGTLFPLDTTPPRLLVPPDSFVYATSTAGIPTASAAVKAFLSTAVANDIVDPRPSITNDAPALLPIGATKITFTATDAS